MKKENEVTSRRGRHAWLQHSEYSDPALLRTYTALWKQTINRSAAPQTQSLCRVSSATGHPFFSCCSILLFACEEQSRVGSRFRLLSPCLPRPDMRADCVMSTLPISLTTDCPIARQSKVTSVEFPQGPDLHFGALGHSRREELFLSALHLSMGCPKFNPDENAVRPFSFQQWLCHCNRPHM